MRYLTLPVAACLLLFCEKPEYTPPRLNCHRISTPLKIDGRLEEPVWQTTPFIVLRNPITGDLPKQRTIVMTGWDSTYLYLAYVVKDSSLESTLSGRDQQLYTQDNVEFFVDPDFDHLYYAEFGWNCLSATYDLFWKGRKKTTRKPDAGWNMPGVLFAVRVHGTVNQSDDVDTGMVVEVALPWKELAELSYDPLKPSLADSLLVNFCRTEGRQPGSENTAWCRTGNRSFHDLHMWGTLKISGPGKERNRLENPFALIP